MFLKPGYDKPSLLELFSCHTSMKIKSTYPMTIADKSPMVIKLESANRLTLVRSLESDVCSTSALLLLQNAALTVELAWQVLVIGLRGVRHMLDLLIAVLQTERGCLRTERHCI